MSRFYVYILYRDVEKTRPYYVGKGCGTRHLRHAKDGATGRGKNLYKNRISALCLKEFGHVPFEIQQENMEEADAFALERELIALWGRADRKAGCLTNATDGGDGSSGHVKSPEVIASIVAKNTGLKRTEEARARMSAWQIGRVMSDEAKQKMREAKLGKPVEWSLERREAHALRTKGVPLSDEACAKISAANRGRIASPETRAKQSEAAKKRVRGPDSEEVRANKKAAQQNRAPISAEARENMRRAALQKPPVSDETRAKMSESHRARHALRQGH